MERLDSPHIEQWFACFIHVGYFQRDTLIGDCVTMHIKIYAQVLGEPIRGVECSCRIAAGNQQGFPIPEINCLNQILLRFQ